MARINNRPSHVPSSRYTWATPGPENNSDQENRDPIANAREKGKERAMPPPQHQSSLLTPTSDGSDARGQKRKRVTHQPEMTEGTKGDSDSDDAKFNKYFDPNQDVKERQRLKRKTRELEHELLDNRDEILRGDGEGLTAAVTRANHLYRNIKQTGDATLDSRLLVNVSDLAYKKTAQLILGDTTTGVDVDEFLSKCITYMRNGGPANDREDGAPSSSRRRTARHGGDSDDEDDTGEALDWEFLGQHACFPNNSRPPVPSFLLGPLSVEKKQRTQTQRRAKQVRDTGGREARLEALSKDDMQQADENGLTQICTRIRNLLVKHIRDAERNLQRAGFTPDDMKTPQGRDMLRKHRLSTNGAVPLFEFVLNPRSFGQTVENIFYISFLIKEGSVGVSHDDDGLPTIAVVTPRTLEDQRKEKTSKHQAVFALDFETWQSLVEAFEVREPMIAHRHDEQEAQLSERGWYT